MVGTSYHDQQIAEGYAGDRVERTVEKKMKGGIGGFASGFGGDSGFAEIVWTMIRMI